MIHFDAAVTRNYGSLDTFVTYMCLEGNLIIEFSDEKTIVKKGDTVLIPACINELILIPETEATLLEVYVS